MRKSWEKFIRIFKKRDLLKLMLNMKNIEARRKVKVKAAVAEKEVAAVQIQRKDTAAVLKMIGIRKKYGF